MPSCKPLPSAPRVRCLLELRPWPAAPGSSLDLLGRAPRPLVRWGAAGQEGVWWLAENSAEETPTFLFPVMLTGACVSAQSEILVGNRGFFENYCFGLVDVFPRQFPKRTCRDGLSSAVLCLPFSERAKIASVPNHRSELKGRDRTFFM